MPTMSLMHDPAILAGQIEECLASSDVRVLCVIGGPRTGKTRAVQQWLADPANRYSATTAYIDCKGLAFNKGNVVGRNAVSANHPQGHYPMFDLNGKHIVVIDEAQLDAELVNRIAVHTSKDRSAYTHALLVLIFQYREDLERFNLPIKEIRICVPIQASLKTK